MKRLFGCIFIHSLARRFVNGASTTSSNERKKINYEVDKIFRLMLKLANGWQSFLEYTHVYGVYKAAKIQLMEAMKMPRI